jgi:hypothetical protein
MNTSIVMPIYSTSLKAILLSMQMYPLRPSPLVHSPLIIQTCDPVSHHVNWTIPTAYRDTGLSSRSLDRFADEMDNIRSAAHVSDCILASAEATGLYFFSPVKNHITLSSFSLRMLSGEEPASVLH